MRWPRPVVHGPQRGQLRLIRLLRMWPERLASRLERMGHCISLSSQLAVMGPHHGSISRRSTMIGSPEKALCISMRSQTVRSNARNASRTGRRPASGINS